MFSGLNSSKKQEPRRTDKETCLFLFDFMGLFLFFVFLNPSWEIGAKCLFLFLSVLEFFAVIVATLFVSIMFKLLAAVVVKMYGRGRGKWLFFSSLCNSFCSSHFNWLWCFLDPIPQNSGSQSFYIIPHIAGINIFTPHQNQTEGQKSLAATLLR